MYPTIGSHLVAEYEVTSNNTDQGLLNQVTDKTRKILEKETLVVVADKWYERREDILNCVMNGIAPNVSMKYDMVLVEASVRNGKMV